MGGLVQDAKGNLYGTTAGGGFFGSGVVFEVKPSGKEKVLYSFTGGTDGASPSSVLVRDGRGNLYGTTFFGGAYGRGTVFEVTPAGTEKVLYSFCSQPNCADGDFPLAGLVLDGVGNLYGTTSAGGSYGGGVVFKLAP